MKTSWKIKNKGHSKICHLDPPSNALHKSSGIDHEKSNCAPIKLEECNNTSPTDMDGMFDQCMKYNIQITSNEGDNNCNSLDHTSNNHINKKQVYPKALVSQKDDTSDNPCTSDILFVLSIEVPGLTLCSQQSNNIRNSFKDLDVFFKKVYYFDEANFSDHIENIRYIVFKLRDFEKEEKSDIEEDLFPSLMTSFCPFVRHSWNCRSNWYKVCGIMPDSASVERSIQASTTSQTFQEQSVIQAAKECGDLVNNIRDDNDAIYKDVNDIDTNIGRQTSKDFKSLLTEMKSEIANMVAEAYELEATTSDSEPSNWDKSNNHEVYCSEPDEDSQANLLDIESETDYSETDENFKAGLYDIKSVKELEATLNISEPDIFDYSDNHDDDYFETNEDLKNDWFDIKLETVEEVNEFETASSNSEPNSWDYSDNHNVDYSETDEDFNADSSVNYLKISSIVEKVNELRITVTNSDPATGSHSDNNEIQYSETDKDFKSESSEIEDQMLYTSASFEDFKWHNN